jgi:hypothetical protein
MRSPHGYKKIPTITTKFLSISFVRQIRLPRFAGEANLPPELLATHLAYEHRGTPLHTIRTIQQNTICPDTGPVHAGGSDGSNDAGGGGAGEIIGEQGSMCGGHEHD